ncbi:MAG: hypothetical protein ACOC2H_09140 [Spirochaetota bacterium]
MLAAKNGIFSLKNIMLYDRSTFKPIKYSLMEVIGELSLSTTPEYAELVGGSLPFAWEAAVSSISSEGTLTIREFLKGVIATSTGGELTENAAEALGSVSQETNRKGDTIFDGTAGITVSVLTGSEENLKDGKYIIIATGSDTFDVYCTTNLAFAMGDRTEFIDDTLKVLSVDLSGTPPVEEEEWGLSFGVAGTIALNEGDAGTFVVRSANTGSDIIDIGSVNTRFDNVGLIAHTPINPADRNYYRIEVFNVGLGGNPFAFTEKAFSEMSLPLKIQYDSAEDLVYRIERVKVA